MQFRVTVPDNAQPEMMIRIRCPDGTETMVNIPKGLRPGDTFVFELQDGQLLNPKALQQTLTNKKRDQGSNSNKNNYNGNDSSIKNKNGNISAADVDADVDVDAATVEATVPTTTLLFIPLTVREPIEKFIIQHEDILLAVSVG
jgi:hypothetical protein